MLTCPESKKGQFETRTNVGFTNPSMEMERKSKFLVTHSFSCYVNGI